MKQLIKMVECWVKYNNPLLPPWKQKWWLIRYKLLKSGEI